MAKMKIVDGAIIFDTDDAEELRRQAKGYDRLAKRPKRAPKRGGPAEVQAKSEQSFTRLAEAAPAAS